MRQPINHQQGLVLVFALLVLLSLTILGVAAVNSSLLQNKMSQGMETYNESFDAAEAALGAVVYESEDKTVLSTDTLLDPLTEARQGAVLDPKTQSLSCFDKTDWTQRRLTSAGLQPGTVNDQGSGDFLTNPDVQSWSSTAFLGEQACLGSSNVIGGSNISCHVFEVRGCGQVAGSRYAVADTMKVSVFAPASNN